MKKSWLTILSLGLPMFVITPLSVSAYATTHSNRDDDKTNINTIFTGDLNMGNGFYENYQPSDNDIIAFLYDQVKNGPNKHVINDLEVGTRTQNGPTEWDVPIGVKSSSTQYTGNVDVTYSILAKTPIDSIITQNPTNVFDYGQNYDITSANLDTKIKLYLKTCYTSLNINQIKVEQNWNDTTYNNQYSKWTINPRDGYSVYSGSKEITVPIKPYPQYKWDTDTEGGSMVVAYQGIYNNGWGVATDGNHTWFDSINKRNSVKIGDNSQFDSNSNGGLVCQYNTQTSGVITPITYSDFIAKTSWFVTTTFSINAHHEDQYIWGNLEGGGFGLREASNKIGFIYGTPKVSNPDENAYSYWDSGINVEIGKKYCISIQHTPQGYFFWNKDVSTKMADNVTIFPPKNNTNIAFGNNPNGTNFGSGQSTRFDGTIYCGRVIVGQTNDLSYNIPNINIDCDVYGVS